jgi:hypothetical protein
LLFSSLGTDIQQQQGNISGHFADISANNLFIGIPENGSFRGTVNTTKHIQFKVTSNPGQTAFSFDGLMQADGTMAGTYCVLEEATGKCSNSGLWSVSPRA